jgi:hypothetical protein
MANFADLAVLVGEDGEEGAAVFDLVLGSVVSVLAKERKLHHLHAAAKRIMDACEFAMHDRPRPLRVV